MKLNKNHALKLTELRVSVKLLKSFTGNNAELRPRLPLPFGVRESNSSVGESQNLKKKIKTFNRKQQLARPISSETYRGGAQSCFVQSIRVPT